MGKTYKVNKKDKFYNESVSRQDVIKLKKKKKQIKKQRKLKMAS